MKKICVLMSTYNGEKYLEEQLKSIINQRNVEVDILIRDDGSTDNTFKILEKYSKNYKNITYYTGKNLRSAQSFMDLIYSCDEYEYYAFADQDDVWDLDKLEIGIRYLNKDYHLYGCKKRIVDQNLNLLNQEDEFPHNLELGSVLLRCYISGCTMVFDNFLRKKILEYEPKIISMHDSWVLKVAFCIGKIYYDKEPHIDYRQHENNVVGAKKNILIRLKKKICFSNNRNLNIRTKMAKELYIGYGKYLNEKEKKLLYYFSHSKEKRIYRLRIIRENFLQVNDFFEKIRVMIYFLLGKI